MASLHLLAAPPSGVLCGAAVKPQNMTEDPNIVDCPDCLWLVLRELRRQESFVLGLVRRAEEKARVQVIKPEVQRG